MELLSTLLIITCFLFQFLNFGSPLPENVDSNQVVYESVHLVDATLCKKEFYFYNKKVNWFQALEFCFSLDQRLATVESKEEEKKIQELMEAKSVTEVWLAGSDLGEEGTWVWTSTGKHLSYANWVPKADGYEPQPDNWQGNEDCLVLYKEPNLGYRWNDVACNKVYTVVCERV